MMERRTKHLLIAAAVVTLALAGWATASASPRAARHRPGTPDRSFGARGRAYSDLPPAYDFGDFTQLAEGPGGTLVDSVERIAAAFTGSTKGAAIERRLPDGSLDRSFGDDGSVPLPAAPAALAVDGSGRVVYAAEGKLHRLGSDGGVDIGFKPGSIGFQPGRIVFAPDGDIIAAGRYQLPAPKDISPETGIVVARFAPGGSPDPSFGKAGVLSFPTLEGNPYSTFEDIAVLADGSLLLLAEGRVLRYRADGTADGAFGEGGSVKLPEGFEPSSLVAAPDGSFRVAGTQRYPDGPRSDFQVFAYGPGGSTDASFGEGGTTTIDVGRGDFPIGLAAAPDGGVILAGESELPDSPPPGPQPVAIRLDSSGHPVPGFGERGVLEVRATVPPAGIEEAEERMSALIVGPSGRIAIAGTDGDALLSVRTIAGTPDPSFGGGSSQVSETTRAPAAASATGLVAAPSGRLFVSAITDSARRTSAPALLQFSAAGGQAPLDPPLGFAPLAVAGPIVADGRRHLASLGHPPGLYEVARVDLSGALDPHFGEGGKVFLPAGIGGHGLVAAGDGGLIVVGHSQGHGMTVLRYDSTGRLDRSFGTGGIAYVGFPQGSATAYTAAVLGDGDLVLAGSAGKEVALARLRPDGRLDRSFGRGGRSVIHLGLFAHATLLARLGGGLIVAGKEQRPGERKSAFALRVDGDGRPRRGFGHGGSLDASAMTRPIAVLPARRKVVLVGSLRKGGVALRRFDGATGHLDRGFGAGGTVIAAAKRGRFHFNAAAAVRDRAGAIVVAGSAGDETLPGSRVELLRFHG